MDPPRTCGILHFSIFYWNIELERNLGFQPRFLISNGSKPQGLSGWGLNIHLPRLPNWQTGTPQPNSMGLISKVLTLRRIESIQVAQFRPILKGPLADAQDVHVSSICFLFSGFFMSQTHTATRFQPLKAPTKQGIRKIPCFWWR